MKSRRTSKPRPVRVAIHMKDGSAHWFAKHDAEKLVGLGMVRIEIVGSARRYHEK